MSRSVFAAHFVDAIGHPPMEFLKRLRLSRAAELLAQTDLPVKAVALHTGYSSRSSFTRAFITFHGAAPRTFRSTTAVPLLRPIRPSGSIVPDVASMLASRGHRPADHTAEAAALLDLASELARNPANLCQQVAEIALPLCRADSAGISVLDGDVWRWCGLAGLYASHRAESLPRAASPASGCFDEQRSHLLSYPDRQFPALAGEPAFVELLLVPFTAHEQRIGVLWLGLHTSERRFEIEDERLTRSLSAYAAAAWRICARSDAMEASIRRTNDFVAILGHELRHPLAAIAASTALITRLGRADSNPAFRQILDTLDRQCRYLSRLVDDLADVSRSNYSNLKLHMEDAELATIIDDAVHAVRGRVEDRAQRLVVSAPRGSTVLRADPVRLVQILVNLLENASKYTPDSGEIQLAVKRQETSAYISVRDNGDGIPREKMAAMFDPFVQIAPSRRRGEGLGLGLAVTERLVSLHGGTIRASSDGPGRGTEFVVRLPMTSGPPDTCLRRWDTTAAPH